jgi:hypothetical protein
LYYWYQAYPSGVQSFSPDGDTYLQTTYPWDNRNIPVTSAGVNILVRGGEIISTATRSGKTNEIWNPGCGPQWYTCYIYCGGYYPPSCFTFGGSGGTVMIERLAASMVVTVDSGGAPIVPGSHVTFAIRPDVATLGGFSTPYQLDTASWTPDAENLGGVASEATLTGACSGGTDCVRTIGGSGTIRLVAHVNGKGFEWSYHIAIPILSLRARPRFVGTGDSVAFEPSWSDGDPITSSNVVSWSWAADSVAGTTSACSAGVVVCKTAVMESGTMTVTIARGGSNHTARIHVARIRCPIDEPILNDTTVRQGMAQLWSMSNPTAIPTYNRKEHRMAVYDSAGTLVYRIFTPDPGDDACHTNSQPPLNEPGTLKTLIHTHPAGVGDTIQCNAGAGLSVITKNFGGPSPADYWGAKDRGERTDDPHFREYAIDKNNVYGYDGFMTFKNTVVGADTVHRPYNNEWKNSYKKHPRSWGSACTLP